ncbi:Di-trans-poly-cis-decaprenylcistransferase-like protein [mine drainage metagenome]|uniref:Di-trans-poly-cis-decaprenylcistransferase-like protein n=1 Tax=mine drainage metagenome TaxID=410659 RepID=T1ALM5_9ZZZZ
MIYTATLPRHVAIIMDGNGRWAESRHRPRSMGHRAGQKAVRATVEASRERGIAALTLFAFSSENWQRPKAEVGALMELFLRALDNEVDDCTPTACACASSARWMLSPRPCASACTRPCSAPRTTTR